MQQNLRKTVVPIAVALLVGLGVLVNHALFVPQPAALGSGELLEQPRVLPDFALVADTGPFLRDELLGHWTLVFAGFTYCPGICPTTLTRLSEAKALLQPEEAGRLSVLFVSVDPRRDTPTRLGEYARRFDPSFRGATGTEDQLHVLLERGLGLVFLSQEAMGEQEARIDHSNHVAIIDPLGRLAGYLSPPFTAEGLATDLKVLLGRSAPWTRTDANR